MINLIRLRESLYYDHSIGHFTWKKISKYHIEKLGSLAGCTCDDGYHYIKIDGRRYKTHRLAWFYYYGSWPKGVIDHINGNGLDNRVCNLRDVSITINAQNHKEGIKKNGLPTGVSLCKNGFRARIQVNKKKMALGVYGTSEEALKAYRLARDEHHNTPVINGGKV